MNGSVRSESAEALTGSIPRQSGFGTSQQCYLPVFLATFPTFPTPPSTRSQAAAPSLSDRYERLRRRADVVSMTDPLSKSLVDAAKSVLEMNLPNATGQVDEIESLLKRLLPAWLKSSRIPSFVLLSSFWYS